jgi:uncharacterized protein (TIGR00369 family)
LPIIRCHATFGAEQGQAMTITDPGDFHQRIRRSFQNQNAMGLLGADISRIQQGMVEIELPFDAKLTQQHGFLHSGVISAALETACTYSAYTVIAPEVSVLTIEFKVNLMSLGRGERFLFRGEITKPGSTIIVADGRGYAVGDGPAKLIASMTSTMMVIRNRQDVVE